MPKTTLQDAINIQTTYGFANESIQIENLYRVIKTRAALSDKAQAETEDNVYKTMQFVMDSRFPGDAPVFFALYNTLSKLKDQDIIRYVNRSFGKFDLVAPAVLVKKFDEYITASTKTVLITECEKFGPELVSLIESHPEIEFTLTYQLNVEILPIVYGGHKNVKIFEGSIYTYGFSSDKFDVIFSVPTFGGRMLIEDEDFICREPGMIAVQNLLYHLNMDGNLVIILPAKITFASGNTEALRHYIENNYKIKEISALPAGLFAPATSIRTFLFNFSTGTTDDVVVRKYKADKQLRRTSICEELILDGEELLFEDEFFDLGNWNIDMAFSKEEDDELRSYYQSSVKKARVKDVASVFRGKAIQGKSDSGNIAVVNISNITDTGIDYESLDLIEDEERKVARYELENEDVLVTSRGTTIKVAVFEAQSMTCIPSANINVIRPKKVMRGTFLKLFLESPVGLKMLEGLHRGTTVININYKDLEDLEVPFPALAEQDSIVNEYNEGLKLYKATITAAEESWKGVQTSIQSRLY